MIGRSIAVAAVFAMVLTGDGRAGDVYSVVTVSLPDATPIQAQVADTPDKRALGLMFRKSLPADRGMLFLMEALDIHSFWMKNCEIPLDIIWLNQRKQVVHLEKSLPPCHSEPCPSYTPSRKALYVLELQAGTIDRQKIALGQTFLFDLPKLP